MAFNSFKTSALALAPPGPEAAFAPGRVAANKSSADIPVIPGICLASSSYLACKLASSVLATGADPPVEAAPVSAAPPVAVEVEMARSSSVSRFFISCLAFASRVFSCELGSGAFPSTPEKLGFAAVISMASSLPSAPVAEAAPVAEGLAFGLSLVASRFSRRAVIFSMLLMVASIDFRSFATKASWSAPAPLDVCKPLEIAEASFK